MKFVSEGPKPRKNAEVMAEALEELKRDGLYVTNAEETEPMDTEMPENNIEEESEEMLDEEEEEEEEKPKPKVKAKVKVAKAAKKVTKAEPKKEVKPMKKGVKTGKAQKS
eukprot:TRINITY_DN2737_c0_g3_i2.p2 TRINITY_DN2737_c0_g3~~TRINITY_DN2737_c0_g3_i2.p2  ORF type:complete len:110 (+),score=55.53 TRINITY_DN2737_c0_g3_i2:149-478(+)